MFKTYIVLLAVILAGLAACSPETTYVDNGDPEDNTSENNTTEDDPGYLEHHGGQFIAHGDPLQDHLSGDSTSGTITTPIEADLESFTHASIQFDATTTPTVDVRLSSDEGSTWSAWANAEITFEEEGAHNAFVDFEEFDTDESTHTQVRFGEITPEAISFLRVKLFDSTGRDLVPGEADFDITSTDEDEDIRIAHFELAAHRAVDIPRADWGGRGHSCSRPSTPQRIIIHHTASPTNDAVSVPARVRQVQNESQITRGYCDMMYHFLIGQDGLIYEGRNELMRGGHALYANDNSVGVVFIGNYTHAGPSQHMMDAGTRLLSALSDQYGITLNRDTIKGHRETGSPTGCPGDALENRFGELIEAAGDVGTTVQGCTTTEENNCAAYGCGCVAGECSGGNCPGSGCTADEIGACSATGCGCVDGECSGGTCAGNGCTARTENQCENYGCGCIDGACSGGACGTTSFTAETRFHPVTPYRSNDTRNDSGGRVPAGTTRMFNLQNVPSDAEAVTANITVANPSAPGHLTVYPCGERPTTSSLNYQPGEARPNQVTVALTPIDQICVYSIAEVDIIVDIAGWWRTSGGHQVEAYTASRLLDTRDSGSAGRLRAGQTRELDFTGLVAPSTPAVSLNVASVNASNHGHLSIYPCGTARPNISHLNLRDDLTRANHVTVPLDSSRKVCIYSHLSDTDLVIDLTGTWTSGGDEYLTAHEPIRVTDTRNTSRPGAESITELHQETDAVIFGNFTVTGSSEPGYAAIFSCEDGYRGSSTVNFSEDTAESNAVIVDASRGGVCAYTSTAAHLIFDTVAAQR